MKIHLILVFCVMATSWQKDTRDNDNIKTYEYGKFSDKSTLNFMYTGTIPPFQPNYIFKMKDNTYSYVRVHYWNTISSVDINYDNKTSSVRFFIKFPFIEFPFGVEGYTSTLYNMKNIPTIWENWYPEK